MLVTYELANGIITHQAKSAECRSDYTFDYI